MRKELHSCKRFIHDQSPHARDIHHDSFTLHNLSYTFYLLIFVPKNVLHPFYGHLDLVFPEVNILGVVLVCQVAADFSETASERL
jgi:hypothetical protein